MRIEQSSQFAAQGLGLGAKSKGTKGKSAFTTATARQEAGAEASANEKADDSPLMHYQKAQANANKELIRISWESTETIAEGGGFRTVEDEKTFNELSRESDRVFSKKTELMRDLLDKLGIKGKLDGCGGEIYPSPHFEYYIETEGDAKNLFIVELEDGELLFTETDKTAKECVDGVIYQNIAYELFGSDIGKLSTDELKQIYSKILGSELKEFSADELRKVYSEHFEIPELDELDELIMELGRTKIDERDSPSQTPIESL